MKQTCLNSTITKLIFYAFTFSILSSCGGGSSSSNIYEVTLKENYGVAQKGPFSIGSLVKLSLLDTKGVVTGDSVQSEVLDKKGRFAYTLPSEWLSNQSFYEISVEGSFIDESQTSETTQQIQLISITNNPAESSVNLLTHWVALRSKVLTEQGISINNALVQAKTELYKLIGTDNISQLDFTQPTQLQSDNALLLLLSGALMDIARQHSLDVKLVIEQIGSDFSDDGKLSLLGDSWFRRMQAAIRDNPERHTDIYSKNLEKRIGLSIPTSSSLPLSIPLASRPVAIVPNEIFAEPGETIVLDASGSHDSGDIINYTWFRIDQQTQFDVPVSDRFAISPNITVPDIESVLLYAIVVTDSAKLTDTAVIRVVVKIPPPNNLAPIADSQINSDAVNTDEDTPVDIVLTGSDPDSDPISFVISTPLLLPNGILEGTAPNLVYTPTLNSTLGDSFTFFVNDSFEDSSPATVEINITAINDAPVADAGLDFTKQGAETATFDGSGTDVDGTIASYLWSQTSGITVSLSDVGIPAPTFITPKISSIPEVLTFQLIVMDNEGAISLADEVVITVTKENQPPTADAGLKQTVTESNTVTLNGSGTDPEDGVTSIFEWIAPTGITLNNTTINKPTFIAPAVTGSRVYIFKLVVKDSKGLASIPDTVEITVNPNQPPQANAGPNQSVDDGSKVTLNGSGTDPEDGVTSIFEWTAPAGVTLSSTTINKPTFIAPAVTGPRVFIFKLVVKDSKGLASAPNTVEITVKHVNKKPAANSFDLGVNQGSSKTIPQGPGKLGGTDPDGDNLTLSDREPPSNGIVSVITLGSGKAYIYTPNPGFCGLDGFKYKVKDDELSSNYATVTIHVNCKPTAHAGKERTVTENDLVTLAGSGTDPEDGVTTIFEWTAPAGISSFSGEKTAKPTFIAPFVSITTKFTFRLTVKDSKSLASSPSTVDVYVKPTKLRSAYIKAISPGPIDASGLDGGDYFGATLAMSADGATLAVGAPGPTKHYVYIYSLDNTNGWEYQTTLSHPGGFSSSLAISNDGRRILAGAAYDNSGQIGVDNRLAGRSAKSTSPSDIKRSGAAYLYKRSLSTGEWVLTTYFKASTPGVDDHFGSSIAISGDGKTIAISANDEDSDNETDENNNDAVNSGAVYVFKLGLSDDNPDHWSQESYLKADNISSTDYFGGFVALDGTGNSLIIGATGEDTGGKDSGAMYYFIRDNSSWSQKQMIKQDNPRAYERFGARFDLSDDGKTFITSDKHAKVENVNAGAAYIFTLNPDSSEWLQQQARLTPLNPSEGEFFGASFSITENGEKVIIGAPGKDELIDLGHPDKSILNSGAAYIFNWDGTSWLQEEGYIKSTNLGKFDFFGETVAISGTGKTISIGAPNEESCAEGIDGEVIVDEEIIDGQLSNDCESAGAVYINPSIQLEAD